MKTANNYVHSNKIDLDILAEMGIAPDQTIRQRVLHPTLKTVGMMVLATIRMRKLREEWRLVDGCRSSW